MGTGSWFPAGPVCRSVQRSWIGLPLTFLFATAWGRGEGGGLSKEPRKVRLTNTFFVADTIWQTQECVHSTKVY